jgi:6,7-dimethyl-8-ribityllumazine synthase
MSEVLPPRPDEGLEGGGVFAIVASRFNARFTESLVENAQRELRAIHPNATVDLSATTGSFEIPLAVKLLAQRGKYDAIIALGVIIEGETRHAELVAQSVTGALQQIALEYETPIIHEVLLLASEQQARARCMGTKLNRGVEAARAAVESARIVRALRAG